MLMSTMTLELNVPEGFSDLGFTPEEIQREVPTFLVIKRFREGAISSGAAAKLLSMSRVQFLDLLGREGIPIFNPTKEEFLAELETVKELSAQVDDRRR
jgi:predicted HTH domain antitoxin